MAPGGALASELHDDIVAYATISTYASPMPSKKPAFAPGSPAHDLRSAVQSFVRSFGLLASDRTPCGTPLSTSHAHALMVLLQAGRRGEELTQQALGAALGIDKSNVTRLCAKMESSGHLGQRRCPNDGRARLVALTASGEKLAARVDRASTERFSRLVAALPSAGDHARIVAALEVLNGAIAATCGEEAAA